MNIKKLIDKVFKLNKSKGLALPTDLISIPMRDSLSEDKISFLDEYKKIYRYIITKETFY